MEPKKIRIEAIKLALVGIEEEGLDAEEILADSINWLYEKYAQTENECYLLSSFTYAGIYANFGFTYEKYQKLFDEILKISKTPQIQMLFLDEKYTKKVKFRKSHIRGMIRKWSPHIHTMAINEVVEDVMMKVKEKQEGIYTYTSGRQICNGREVPKDEYRLIIYGNKAQFLDIRQNQYYTIEKS